MSHRGIRRGTDGHVVHRHRHIQCGIRLEVQAHARRQKQLGPVQLEQAGIIPGQTQRISAQRIVRHHNVSNLAARGGGSIFRQRRHRVLQRHRRRSLIHIATGDDKQPVDQIGISVGGSRGEHQFFQIIIEHRRERSAGTRPQVDGRFAWRGSCEHGEVDGEQCADRALSQVGRAGRRRRGVEQSARRRRVGHLRKSRQQVPQSHVADQEFRGVITQRDIRPADRDPAWLGNFQVDRNCDGVTDCSAEVARDRYLRIRTRRSRRSNAHRQFRNIRDRNLSDDTLDAGRVVGLQASVECDVGNQRGIRQRIGGKSIVDLRDQTLRQCGVRRVIRPAAIRIAEESRDMNTIIVDGRKLTRILRIVINSQRRDIENLFGLVLSSLRHGRRKVSHHERPSLVGELGRF